MLTSLRLVFPPISNQEADWLKNDPDILKLMEDSSLYMIGRRAELFFRNIEVTFEKLGFKFDLERDGEIIRDGVWLDLSFLDKHHTSSDLKIEAGSKFLRVWDSTRTNILYWCTVDVLLHDYWRRRVSVSNLNSIRDMTTFELLYVGISKKDDAFKRLVLNPHEKRLAALTHEFPLRNGARISDELWFFFFRIDPLHIRTFGIEDDEIDLLDPPRPNHVAITADAEKAFVNLMNAKYNTIKFKTYPFSTDGLYGEGLDRFGYIIDEDLTFVTSTLTIRGSFGSLPNSMVLKEQPADAIIVEGDDVTFCKYDRGVA